MIKEHVETCQCDGTGRMQHADEVYPGSPCQVKQVCETPGTCGHAQDLYDGDRISSDDYEWGLCWYCRGLARSAF